MVFFTKGMFKYLRKTCVFVTRRLPAPQTYIGSILAAVNPYQPLAGLYDAPAMETYSRHHLGEISPHIFAVANECYRSLWKRLQNQCVLIRWVPARAALR